MRKRLVPGALLLGMLFSGAAPLLAPELPAFDSPWARDPLWDDGRAEVSLYDARRPQYGKIESYQAVFIVVKEDFHRELLVKADPPYEGKPLLPVLKLNAIHSYWTAHHPSHLNPRPGDLLEDQPPLALRSLRFVPGLELRRRVLPSLISNNLRRPLEFAEAQITVIEERILSTPAG